MRLLCFARGSSCEAAGGGEGKVNGGSGTAAKAAARFWELLPSKKTVLPAVGGALLSQLAVEDPLGSGLAAPSS